MSDEGKRNREAVGADEWRVFCAIELSEEVRRHTSQHAEEVRRKVAGARAAWPRAENLHLTLKFVGEVAVPRVEALSRAAGLAASHCRPFTLTVEGAGSFPTRGLPRVLWLGIREDSGELSVLHQELEKACAAEGFPREDRIFRPHLTVARLRSPQGARELAEAHRRTGFEAVELAVKDIVVLRSELGPGGSRYTEISRHPLGPAR